MRHLRIALLLPLSASLLFGAGRRKLFELDLSKFVGGQADLAAYVWGIRFSPDETRIAIGFSPRFFHDPHGQAVVIVSVDHPETVLRVFDVKSLSFWPSLGNLVWSPSGSALVVRTRPTPVILRLDSKAGCDLPQESGFLGFLSGNRMAVGSNHEIETRGPDCSLLNTWTPDGQEFVLATSPGRNLFAMQRYFRSTDTSVIEIVDAKSHEIKQHWPPNTLRTTHGFVFAEQDKSICSGAWPPKQNRPRAVCWDIDTGAKVAENDKVALWDSGGLGGIAGSGGDLLAMTDYRYTIREGKFWDFLDMAGVEDAPKRQVVWDIRTGHEVASWSSGLQQQLLVGRDLSNAMKQSRPTVLSISPTGKYVAEGGSGKVTVYAHNP